MSSRGFYWLDLWRCSVACWVMAVTASRLQVVLGVVKKWYFMGFDEWRVNGQLALCDSELQRCHSRETSYGKLGRVLFRRNHPFACPPSLVGHVILRWNCDFSPLSAPVRVAYEGELQFGQGASDMGCSGEG